MYVATKSIILQGDSLYEIKDEDKKLLISLLASFSEAINQKGLLSDIIELMHEKKKFDEEDAYELLNKISMECIQSEKDLYTDFESFTSKLEKEIEKTHN